MTGFGLILRALVLRPLVRERTRSALTLGGIAAGVAVLVAIQLANQSALRAFGESVDAISGRANYQIVSEAAPLDENLLLSLRGLWDIEGRFAPVIDVDGLVDTTGVPIRVLGVDLLSDLHFRDYRFAEILTNRERPADARVPEASDAVTFLELFRDDSVILPKSFADESALKLGSTIRIDVLGHRKDLVVRGLLEARGPATAFNGSLAIVDIATAQKAFGLGGSLSRVDLLVPGEHEPTLAAIRSALPAGVRLERPSRRSERVGKMLRAFRVNLFALAAISLLVGVFLVHNTVLISILRRRADVGIVKTLGATPRQIFAVFLCEGALFGLAGAILGIGAGWILARGTLGMIAGTINTLYVVTAPSAVVLDWRLAMLAIGLGVAVSSLSVLQPSLEAASIPPSVLIRAGLHQRVDRRAMLRAAAIGVVLLLAAWAVTRIGPVRGIPIAGYASVLIVVAGFSLLVPLVITTTARSLAPVLERTAGLSGKLAALSLPSSLRRVAVAGAALSVAIGMMVAVAIMIGSFRETVRVWVAQTVKSDLWLRPAKGLSNAPLAVFPDSISEELRRMPFIDAIDRFRGRDMLFRDEIVIVGSGDFDVAASHGDLPMVRPSSARRALDEARKRGGVIVSESLAVKAGLEPGSVIELATARGLERFSVTGIYHDYSNDRGVIVMDRSRWIASFRDTSINTIAVFLKPGTDAEQARVALEKTLGAKYRAFGFTNATIRREVMRIFDQTFLITWALLVIAISVAVIGIINTLTAMILERRREIALLGVLGMPANDIRRMLVLESGILGLASVLLGLANGWALSLILIHVINRQSFGWTISFDPPWALIGLSLVLTLASTVLAGLVPAGVAARIRRSEALAGE